MEKKFEENSRALAESTGREHWQSAFHSKGAKATKTTLSDLSVVQIDQHISAQNKYCRIESGSNLTHHAQGPEADSSALDPARDPNGKDIQYGKG